MRKLKIFVFVLLFLIASTALVHAQTIPTCQATGTTLALAPWYCTQISGPVASVWYTWEPIAFLAIMLSFLIAAIMFMTGVAFRNEKLRNYAIGELYEATATTIIAVMFLFLSAAVFGIIPALFTGPINPYNTALNYIANTESVTQGAIQPLFGIIMINSFYSSASLTFRTKPTINPETNQANPLPLASQIIGTGSQVFNNLANLVTLLFDAPARALGYLLVDGLIILHTQFYLMLFFMYTAIPVFLIPGIVFRAIFPLRSLGGVMIAIAIAFYLIMPLLFSVAYALTNSGVTQLLDTYSQQLNLNGQGTGAQTNAASPNAPLVLALQGLESAMGTYWLSILFYPALIAAISYESIKIIADFIGGATRATGKLRGL